MKQVNFLYYGADYKILLDAAKSKIKELEIDEFDVINYDLNDTELIDVVQELTTVNFLSDKKAIFLNSIFLLPKFSDKDISAFENYLKNPNEETYLFILDPRIQFDYENEKFNSIKLYVEMVQFENPVGVSLVEMITNNLNKEGYKITDEAVHELINRTQNDYLLIEKEIIKLKLYAIERKSIDVEIVKALVSKNIENNIFELLSAYFEKDISRTIEIYYDLLTLNISPLEIVAKISNRLRQILLCKILVDMKKSKVEIAKYFNIKEGRAYYLMEDAKKVSLRKIEDTLIKISDLDYQIKSGNIEIKLGVEMFLLKGI